MPSTSMCIDSKQLRSYVQGGLPSLDSQAIRHHLLQCEKCRSAAHALANTGSDTCAVGQTPLPPPTRQQPETDFTFLQPAQEPDELGRLGGFRVLRLIGQGGMAMVFEAQDLTLHRSVALKVMKTWKDEVASVDRFIRESRAAAAVKNEHLITIYQVGQEGPTVFLAMELLDGETLESWRDRKGRPAPKEIVRLAREMAIGLQAIHAKGFVHRDIKPSNIWLESPKSKVRILDFGLARSVKDEMKITQTGLVVGTPAFMSPEQARGETLDGRSDLFSLGCVLYYLCTGSEPFKGDTIMAQIMALATVDPKPVHEVDGAIPKKLSDLVMRLLTKNPDERIQSADELIKILTAPAGTQVARRSGIQPAPIAKSSENDTFDTDPIITPSRQFKKVRKPRPSKRPTWLPWAALGVGMVFMVGAGIAIGPMLLGPHPKPQPTDTHATHHADDKRPRDDKQPPRPREDAVYLSDLTPTKKERWPHRPPPDVRDLPDFFRHISVNGRDYPRSIGMHADPRGPVTLTYDLNKKYDRFEAEVAINDSSRGAESPLRFTVYGDDKELWRSRGIKEQSDRQTVDVSVRGFSRLKLEVDCGHRVGGAHGVWLDARLVPERR